VSPAQGRGRAASAAYWLGPSLLCLALYWRAFNAWFRADDFAWLGTGIYVQNFHDLLIALFAPQAQGTIRPLSERMFFLAGFSIDSLFALLDRLLKNFQPPSVAKSIQAPRKLKAET